MDANSRLTLASSSALDTVRGRIRAAAERAQRDPDSVRLIAVTKGVETSRIAAALAAGVTDVGENRVQEAETKRAEVMDMPGVAAASLCWHMLGHVQRNKARRVATSFDWVHSVDSLILAEKLSQERPPTEPPLRVLIEVELTGLPGRSGVAPSGLAALVTPVQSLSHIQVTGLMAIAAPAPDPEVARPTFARLRRLRDAAQESSGVALPELSMGMSDDFEVAIEEGATLVRIGRAIFGPRMV